MRRFLDRPEFLLMLGGLALAVLSIVPELLLAAHLTTGGAAGPVVVAVVNRLIGVLTVFGSALCAGGVVLAVVRRPASSTR
jgi:hypothetical protein